MSDPYIVEMDASYLSRIPRGGSILLQLPDGMKQYSKKIVDCLRKIKQDARIVVDASPTYGACDLHLDNIEALDPDLVIHIGHNMYPRKLGFVDKTDEAVSRTVFIPAYSSLHLSLDVLDQLTEILLDLNAKKVSILATIQHVKELPRIAQYLKTKGVETLIPEPRFPEMEKGQVLGCEYSALIKADKTVDAHILVSGGDFHYLGALLASTKPVIKVDPYTSQVSVDLEARDRIIRKRYYKIMKAFDASTFGIIIGSKTGQYRPWIVKALREALESEGRNYVEFIIGSLTVDALLNMDTPEIDAYVVTSCPRLPIDDLDEFHKPVLTPGEALMVLKKKLDRYLFPWF
jgi:2-(3-amino-3-carboxypropyl)histidine synthase